MKLNYWTDVMDKRPIPNLSKVKRIPVANGMDGSRRESQEKTVTGDRLTRDSEPMAHVKRTVDMEIHQPRPARD